MNSIARPQSTGIVREGFGETAIERRGETASTMMAAQAQAEIQARYVMALQRPRDEDSVRVRLLRECERPNFAAKAFYSVPRGDKPGRLTGKSGRIEGLSVRFAEAAIRVSGNILQGTRTVYDDDFKRMVSVSATNLETNAVYSKDIVIEKTVERSRVRDGQVVLGSRTNSAGKDVFIVQCTEEELLQKESALVSRAFRTLALRLVPADTLEECEQRVVRTIRAEDAKDPDAARKSVADAFAGLNVLPADLKDYLGHDLAQCSPAELEDLRGLFMAIREGEVTWAEIVAEKAARTSGDGAKSDEAQSRGSRVAEAVQARARQRRGGAPVAGSSDPSASAASSSPAADAAATSPGGRPEPPNAA